MKTWIKNLLDGKRDEGDIDFLEGFYNGVEYALVHAASKLELVEAMECCKEAVNQAMEGMKRTIEEAVEGDGNEGQSSDRNRMKLLINISNHPSSKWAEEQKSGWDMIVDIPFPDIPPELGAEDKEYQDLLNKTLMAINANVANAEMLLYPEKVDVYLMVQGEFSFCYSLVSAMRWTCRIVIPTTKREAVEEIQPDSSVKKTTIFKFVRWREI